MLCILLALFGAALLMERSSAQEPDATFKAIDNRKILLLHPYGQVGLVESGRFSSGNSCYIDDRHANLYDLIKGSFRRRCLWYRRLPGGRLKDGDGTLLYDDKAPERDQVNHMWWLANAAQAHYMRYHTYPGREQDLLNACLPEHVFLKHSAPGIKLVLGSQTDKNRIERARNGLPWADEPAASPGQIHCLCATDGSFFMIRGFDRDGQPLTASPPGDHFFIELKQGRDLTAEHLMTFKDVCLPTSDWRQIRVQISDSGEVKSQVERWTMLISTVLWLCFAGSLAFLFKARTTKSVRVQVFSTIVFAISLLSTLVWYIFLYMR